MKLADIQMFRLIAFRGNAKKEDTKKPKANTKTDGAEQLEKGAEATAIMSRAKIAIDAHRGKDSVVKFSDLTFEEKLAKKDGKLFTGQIECELENGEKMVVQYKEGKCTETTGNYRTYEKLSDGTVCEWHTGTGIKTYERLPDGSETRWHWKTGKIIFQELADGTEIHYSRRKDVKLAEYKTNGSATEWDEETGLKVYEKLPNGTVTRWDRETGLKVCEKLPNGTITEWDGKTGLIIKTDNQQ